MLLDKSKIKNILFVDIETVPMVADFDELPLALRDLWIRKALTIKDSEGLTPQELFFEKAGIFSEFGKIICISAGFFYGAEDDLMFRCKTFWDDSEKVLLENFANLLEEKFNSPDHYICGHNVKEFDIPYMARRMLINQVPLPHILNIPGRKPWEVKFIDTLELWKFGDYKNYTSLALLAAVFNLPTPKDDIAGNDVARVYWRENNLERIAVYCSKDVVTTARLYLRYCIAGDLPDDRVESLV